MGGDEPVCSSRGRSVGRGRVLYLCCNPLMARVDGDVYCWHRSQKAIDACVAGLDKEERSNSQYIGVIASPPRME